MSGPGTAVLLLGATGRLGSEIMAALRDRRELAVIGAARTAASIGDTPVIALDVTDASRRAGHVTAISEAVAGHHRVVLVDSVLDRTSAPSMRRSVSGATRLVLESASALQSHGHDVSIVAASTTAVLAPRPYQTPYGLAKRGQLCRYAAAGFPGWAILLPMLRRQGAPSSVTGPGLPGWLAPITDVACHAWGYQEAAHKVVDTLSRDDGTFSLLATAHAPVHRVSAEAAPASLAQRTACLFAVPPLVLGGWTVGRRSPHLQRLASYSLLYATPPALRRRVDHHLTPPARVAAFARRLGTPVTWMGP